MSEATLPTFSTSNYPVMEQSASFISTSTRQLSVVPEEAAFTADIGNLFIEGISKLRLEYEAALSIDGPKVIYDIHAMFKDEEPKEPVEVVAIHYDEKDFF